MTYQNIKTTSVTITALPNKPVASVVLEAINYATDMNLVTTLIIDEKEYHIDPNALVSNILGQQITKKQLEVEAPLVQNP